MEIYVNLCPSFRHLGFIKLTRCTVQLTYFSLQVLILADAFIAAYYTSIREALTGYTFRLAIVFVHEYNIEILRKEAKFWFRPVYNSLIRESSH